MLVVLATLLLTGSRRAAALPELDQGKLVDQPDYVATSLMKAAARLNHLNPASRDDASLYASRASDVAQIEPVVQRAVRRMSHSTRALVMGLAGPDGAGGMQSPPTWDGVWFEPKPSGGGKPHLYLMDMHTGRGIAVNTKTGYYRVVRLSQSQMRATRRNIDKRFHIIKRGFGSAIRVVHRRK